MRSTNSRGNNYQYVQPIRRTAHTPAQMSTHTQPHTTAHTTQQVYQTPSRHNFHSISHLLPSAQQHSQYINISPAHTKKPYYLVDNRQTTASVATNTNNNITRPAQQHVQQHVFQYTEPVQTYQYDPLDANEEPSVDPNYDDLAQTRTKLPAFTSPKLWGPPAWIRLHVNSMLYADRPSALDRKMTEQHVRSLPWSLICFSCRRHAQAYIKKNLKDSDLDSHANLFTFFWKFHNAVNRRLKKPEISISDAYNMYLERLPGLKRTPPKDVVVKNY